MTENNIVVVPTAAVPMSSSHDFTISVKQQMSTRVFGIGDSLDSTTVSMGLRIRLRATLSWANEGLDRD